MTKINNVMLFYLYKLFMDKKNYYRLGSSIQIYFQKS